MYGIDSDSVL